MLLRVTLINLGTSPIEYQPMYVGSDGDIEREEKVQLAVGEQCELPYPLQRSEGEASEAWHLLTQTVPWRLASCLPMTP